MMTSFGNRGEQNSNQRQNWTTAHQREKHTQKNVENCGTDHIGGSRKNIIEREIKID